MEYLFGAVADHVPALEPYKWTLMYISAAVGVAGAFIYRFDLLSLLGQFVGADVNVTPFGITLTGLAIGRGANYLHQIIDMYFTKSETA